MLQGIKERELIFIHLFPSENFGAINEYKGEVIIHFIFDISCLVDLGHFTQTILAVTYYKESVNLYVFRQCNNPAAPNTGA